MAFCTRCERFDLQSFSKGFFSRTYDFFATDTSGCSFCRLLLESLETVADPDHVSRLRKALSGPSGLRIHFWITRSQASLIGNPGLHMTHLNAAIDEVGDIIEIKGGIMDVQADKCISFHTAADPGSLALTSRDVIGEIHSDTRPWSAPLFDGIKSWHINCRTNHVSCNQTLSQTRKFDCEDVELPTRYMEIISRDENTPDQSTLRFVLREALGERGRYIALSHRWTEQSKIAMTTRQNYLCRTRSCAHHTSCPTWGCEDLTELFSEASWLAVNLGITKIWIDSICIIQDDPDDWKRESIKMAEYYQFAWLTIAATQTTPTGGLRSDLQLTDIPKLARLPYRDSKGQQHGYFYLQVVDRNALASDYLEQVSNSELLNRGWVFQEWLLSRRTLSFSGASWGIFMQCQNGDNPQAMTGDHVQNQTRLGIDKAFRKNLQLSWSSSDEIFAAWRRIVETYSGLELTRIDEDRIVALSGVTHEVGEALQALQPAGVLHYCYSGIYFHDNLGILWEQAESQSCSRIQSIPSWSWACIKIQSSPDDDQQSPRGAKVQWTGVGKRFEVIGRAESMQHSSILALRGKVVQVSIDAHLVGESRTIITDMTRDFRTTIADLTEHDHDAGREHWRGVATYRTPANTVGWASLEHPDYENDAACRSAQNIVAFFVLKWYSSHASFGLGNLFKKHAIFSVLYLRQVENSMYTPCYERVGIGRLFEPEVSQLFDAASEQTVWII